jgi:preprotein translocase subunit SecF
MVATKGIKKGIDFTGGTIVNVQYNGYTSDASGNIDLNFIKNNLETNGFAVKGVSLINTATSGAKIVEIKLSGVLDEKDRNNFENA